MDEIKKRAIEMRAAGESWGAIAEKLDRSRSTVRFWCRGMDAPASAPITPDQPAEILPRELPEIARWDNDKAVDPFKLGLDFSTDDDHDVPIEDLIKSRRKRFAVKSKKHAKKRINQVRVKMRGPIAVTHFGDPHVDDDGCNWPRLLRTVETVSKTPGMFAGNIGDTTNNWVGRLQRLYANQSTTIDEAVRLAHWLFHSVPWFYCVLGNHDKWHQGSQLMRYLTASASIAVRAETTARIEVLFPKGDPIRLVAKHDFKGSSIWNRAHGPLRESKLNPWGDVYISGHRHIWVSHYEEGGDTKPRWSLIVRGFKFFDEYAEELGFHEHEHGETCTTIFDPESKSPMERVRVVWDVEEAADMLTWLRRRYGYHRQLLQNPIG